MSTNNLNNETEKSSVQNKKLNIEIDAVVKVSQDSQIQNNNTSKTFKNDNYNENNADIKLKKSHKLSSETKMKIAVIIGTIIVFTTLIVGAYIKLYWLRLSGILIGIFIVLGATFVHIIKTFMEIYKERKPKNNSEINMDCDNHDNDNQDTQKGIERYNATNNTKNNSSSININNTKKQIEIANKKLAKKTKITVKRLIIGMVVCFLLIAIGGSIAEVTSIGFILLGIGVVGFVGTFLFLITKNIYDRKKYFKYLSVDKSQLKEFYNIRVGVCAKCMQHSSALSHKRKCNGIDALYAVWVLPLDGVDILHINVEEPDFDKRNQLVMLSKNKYEVGDKVRFYQNKSNNKDCYTIE